LLITEVEKKMMLELARTMVLSFWLTGI